MCASRLLHLRLAQWLCISCLLIVQDAHSFSPSHVPLWWLKQRLPHLSVRSTSEYMDVLRPNSASRLPDQAPTPPPIKVPGPLTKEASEHWLASRGEGDAPESRIPPSWLLSRSEWHLLFNKYHNSMRAEGWGFEHLTARERSLLPDNLQRERSDKAAEASAVNVDFFTQLIEHIPTEDQLYSNLNRRKEDEAEPWSAAAYSPPAPVVDIFHPPGIKLDKQHYATFGSICLHLFRDWSEEAADVRNEVYGPIVEQVKRRFPITGNGPPPRVLVPGAALSRLAFELMMAGYDVECNEYSALFVNVVDFLFNVCTEPMSIFPLAHLFADNRHLATQYTKLQVPARMPLAEARAAGRRMRLSAGDFVELYKSSGPAHRKFDCVVTCFFIDTGDHVLDYVETIDDVLEEGGEWINLGPLAYDGSVRLKLSWEELQAVWEGLGYRFDSVTQMYSAYYLQPGVKLSTEQFDSVFSTAVKPRSH